MATTKIVYPHGIAAGDIVRIKSGGPAMTVTHARARDVTAVWFEMGCMRQEIVPVVALVPSEADGGWAGYTVTATANNPYPGDDDGTL